MIIFHKAWRNTRQFESIIVILALRKFGFSSGKMSMTFAELNLRHQGNAQKTTNLVRRAIRMGYDAVVINIDIGQMESGREAGNVSSFIVAIC